MIKHLVVIEGPTASGKTSLSIALAKHLKTCIFSADSRQFYKELTIGTAKPSLEEQEGIPHFFIDSHSVQDEVTSAQYEKEALAELENQFKFYDTIVLTGGSGMFIDALCMGLDDIPADKKVRDQLYAEYESNGIKGLLSELEEKDLEFFEKVDRSNPSRVIRALEVIRISGSKFSTFRKQKPKTRPFNVTRFVIEHEREKLYERINKRVDIMMNNGLLEEVKSVQEFRHLSSLNTVGYKELFAYLENKCTLEEAIENIKQNTRRYAKRQLTWFRRHEDAHWIKYNETEKMLNEINQILSMHNKME